MTLKELRVRFGLTQSDLAKRVGVKRGTIARYESGDRRPSIKMICLLAQNLDVCIGDVFSCFVDAQMDDSVIPR